MRIVIIGAGNTGRNLATKLCEMKHDLVIVDISSERLAEIESQLDILTVEGSGSSPDVLERAEIAKADLLIAVTNSDEVNILACQVAHAFGVQRKVARVANAALMTCPHLDFSSLGVDLMVSHKEEAAREIFNVLRHPGVLEVVNLFEDRLVVAGIRIDADSPLLRGSLAGLKSEALLSKVRLVALMRGDELSIPRGDTTFMADDEVYVALKPDDLPEFLDWHHPLRKGFEKIVIAGGGELGLELARRLETGLIPAVLLERDPDRAEDCSSLLQRILVLHGDASDQETLKNAGVGLNTAFVAITGDEELNIISCILAGKLGAAFTVAQVAKPEYVPIVKSLSLLDRVVSAHLSMSNAILRFIRGRHVKAAAQLQKVPGELLHVAVRRKHRWAGRAVGDVKVPQGSVIVGVLRDGEVHVPTGGFVIASGDHLAMFALPDMVEKIQSLFKE